MFWVTDGGLAHYPQRMSMNDGIKLDGSRVQKRGRGTAVAGGIGGLGLIGAILIYLLTGQAPDPQMFNPPSVNSEDGGDLADTCKTGADANTSTECWMLAGAAHHTVLSTATTLETWQDLAEIAQMELAVIDESTTARGFAQTLRLNQAYCRLTQGV